jgi:hypothetical protein
MSTRLLQRLRLDESHVARRTAGMKIFPFLFFVAATSSVALCSPGGVLETVTKIQVDPTAVEQPDKVTDPVAVNLVRYNLRAAVKDAHLEEGKSPITAHFVLDAYSSQGAAKRVLGIGSGQTTSTIDGRLVIQDASGKELANVKIHVHGTVAFSQGDGNGHPTSDFEQRLLQEIERLK